MRKVIFVDRDGTILCEPADEQIDSFQKMEFNYNYNKTSQNEIIHPFIRD